MNSHGKRLKIALDTLGCKVNQAETERLARQLRAAGYVLVDSVEAADIYILNTCTVTSTADSKSRHLLRRARRRNPNAFIIATGCYAERVLPGLAGMVGDGIVIGNRDKERLPERLAQAGYGGLPAAGTVTPLYEQTGFRTRAFIKVQDGCDSFCAYCVVPRVRGRGRSLPLEQVIAEVKGRAAEGYRELVITGVEVGTYSDGGTDLAGLLRRVLAETDIARLRLSSLQPAEVTPELVSLWRDGRLCRHFHLSLQSGSDTVLRRMRRRYSAGEYAAAVKLIREQTPEAAITTDIIVGFPGETEAEFAQSEAFVRGMGFARIHVFSYSPRPGTLAARLPGPVAAETKKARRDVMLTLAGEALQGYNARFAGREMPVLWEGRVSGVWSGLTDNYIRVYTGTDRELSNRTLPARLLRAEGEGFRGELAEG